MDFSTRVVVKECLRLSNTVPGCLPRITPKGGLNIEGIHIPENVSCTILLIMREQSSHFGECTVEKDEPATLII